MGKISTNSAENTEKHDKRSNKIVKESQIKCSHCLKTLSLRRIRKHEAACSATNLILPEGYKVERRSENGGLIYVCPCGHRDRRQRIFKHLTKCQASAPSQTFSQSIEELKNYQQGILPSHVSLSELAPVVVDCCQSISKTIEEIEKEEAMNHQKEQTFSTASKNISEFDEKCEELPQISSFEEVANDAPVYFDSRTYPKFSEFQQPKEGSPLTDLSTRYKIFTISLLLRFTGYFSKGLNMWVGSRCEIINTQRFLTQLNSHTSIFRGQLRTLTQVSEDLEGIARVDESIISVISQEHLINRLKEALENYQYAAIWYRSHTAPLVERQKKRAPRTHWETRKMRKYIAQTRWKSRKWGVRIRPMTMMQMRERSVFCEEMDEMYLLKYHMARPIPKNHKKAYFAKKDKLIINYAIHRIADAFTADFYVDFVQFQMKTFTDNVPKYPYCNKINLFDTKEGYERWEKSRPKQLPTTCVWLGVSRFYLLKRKSLIKAIYESCQTRFNRKMPQKSEEEIYKLVVKWYEENNLIDKDDEWELKEYWTNPEYNKKIENQIEEVLHPEPLTFPKLDEKMLEEPPPIEEPEICVLLPKPILEEMQPSSIDVTLYSQEDLLSKDFSVTAEERFKQLDCMNFQRCSKLKCVAWLSGSILKCFVCNSSFHVTCWPKNNFCPICEIMNDIYGLSPYLPHGTLTCLSNFPILNKPILQIPVQSVWPEGEKHYIKQIQDNFSRQQYCVTNKFYDTFVIYPFYNPNLKCLHERDEQIIQTYEDLRLSFPVVVKFINDKKGKGLVARRDIMKDELVATYSGNVMSLAQCGKYGDKNIKDYVFQLISGPDASSTFVVYPKDFASSGFFMNHGPEKGKKTNIKAEIALIKSGPIIILQALRKIKCGEELLYNYNGKYDSFDTIAFE